MKKKQINNKQAKVQECQVERADTIICLGYAGLQLVFYSQVLNQIIYAQPAQLTAKFLLSMCGLKWLLENFPYEGEGEPNPYGFDTDDVVGYLVGECQDAGAFSPSRVRPEGVYLADDKSTIIINVGRETYFSDDRPVSAANDVHIYMQAGNGLGLSSTTPSATKEEVAEFERFIDSWLYRSSNDAMLVKGWFVASVFAGAQTRRPHMCVTGRRGIGKTVLRDTLGGLFGPAALLIDGTSTAIGISQWLKGRPLPIFVDEAEMHASNASMQGIIRMARSSYSDAGEGRLVGSGTGKSRATPVVSPFFLTCIQPPKFEASDASRWVEVEVTGLKSQAATNPSKLSHDEQYREEVGAKLRAMLLRRWACNRESVHVFRDALLKAIGDARLADTLSPLFAGYWILKHKTPVKPVAAERLVKKLSGTVQDVKDHQATDEQECLSALFTKCLSVRSLRGEGKLSIAEMVQRVTEGDSLADIQLQRLGIRVMRKASQWVIAISVSTSHQGVQSVFAGTRWARGNWGAVLKRLPGACGETQRVLGVATKVVEFPVPGELIDTVAALEPSLKKAA